MLSLETIEAENGKIAVEMFKLHSPKLVFMDIDMPILDGIKATESIKDLDPTALVIGLSGRSQGKETKIFDDYREKPFKLADIEALLNKFGVYEDSD